MDKLAINRQNFAQVDSNSSLLLDYGRSSQGGLPDYIKVNCCCYFP